MILFVVVLTKCHKSVVVVSSKRKLTHRKECNGSIHEFQDYACRYVVIYENRSILRNFDKFMVDTCDTLNEKF